MSHFFKGLSLNTITVVIASASGLALGYATAAHFASRAKGLLLEQFQIEKSEAVEKADLTIRELRDELSSSQDIRAGDNSESAKSKSKKKNKGKNKNKGKSGTTESSEVAKLKNAQADLEKSHTVELAKLNTANSATLAELEKAAESQKADFSKALHSLQQELDEAREASVAVPAGNAEFITALEAAGSDLSPIMEAIISNESQRAAVLADASGIIVAQSGDGDISDSISASASFLTSIPSKLQGMLPLDKQYGFRLSDQSSTITGRTFDLSGDTLALVTVGPAAPADDSIDLAINSLHKALE